MRYPLERHRHVRSALHHRRLHDAHKYKLTLSFIVDVLDDGLRLYRRHFGRFVLLAATAIVPLTMLTGLTVWLGSLHTAWIGAMIAAWLPIALLLGMYWIGSLSHAAVAALGGRPIVLQSVLAIAPRSALRYSIWTLLRVLRALFFYVVAAVTLGVGFMCLFVLVGRMVFDRWGGSMLLQLSQTLELLILWLGSFCMLVLIAGMPLANVAFGLQPWLQDGSPPTVADSRSAELWSGADEEGMYLAVALAVVCLGTLIAVSLITLLAPAVQNTPAGLGVLPWIGMLVAAVLVLPLLPIWMALVYQKLAADVDGVELDSRIAAWRGSIGA